MRRRVDWSLPGVHCLRGEPHGKELVVEEPGWLKADRDRVLDTLEGARR